MQLVDGDLSAIEDNDSQTYQSQGARPKTQQPIRPCDRPWSRYRKESMQSNSSSEMEYPQSGRSQNRRMQGNKAKTLGGCTPTQRANHWGTGGHENSKYHGMLERFCYGLKTDAWLMSLILG